MKMKLESTSRTVYAIARRNSVISDGYDDVASAQQQLAYIEDTMRHVGLKPDVHVVEVEVQTTIGRPHAYVVPNEQDEDEAPTAEEAGAASTGEAGTKQY